MTGSPAWTPCPAEVTLSAGELAALAAVPGGAHLLQPDLQCDVQAGHTAGHMAMAQSYSGPFGPYERWIRWDTRAREFVTYRADQLCLHEFPSRTLLGDGDPCPLPAGHEGQCSPACVPPAEADIARSARHGWPREVPGGAT